MNLDDRPNVVTTRNDHSGHHGQNCLGGGFTVHAHTPADDGD